MIGTTSDAFDQTNQVKLIDPLEEMNVRRISVTNSRVSKMLDSSRKHGSL